MREKVTLKKNHISSEKKKSLVLLSIYMISEDGGRSLVKRGVRNQAAESLNG